MAQSERKSSKAIWIVLATLGGICFLVIALCCGAGIWFTRFPSVPATASNPFVVSSVAVPTFPSATSSRSYPGIGAKREVVLGDGSGYGTPPGSSTRLWIYLPEKSQATGELPCILICGAGSTLMHGMRLSEGDEAEHLPYLKAGIAVVAYDTDGADDIEPTLEASSFDSFRSSMAGLVNARNAFEYTIANVPEVNPKQIFAAGHSSAGTLALLYAEHEPRLAGCIAYAPCIDLKKHLPGFLVRTLSSSMKGLPEFLVQSSPRTHEQRLLCPTMVFHAEDDSNQPIGQSRDFVKRMKVLGKDVTLKEVATGEHYDSMIKEGIPSGIAWIQKQKR